MMGTNNQTTANISAAEMVCATQEHSSVIQEGSTIIPQMVGFQEGREGHVNMDLFKQATAFLLQARETHRLTQSIPALVCFSHQCDCQPLP
ncbi:hypothetical protein CesoFtcFv8_004758 [Champsocephalus esox]|uniref:Uncharacterized protein n=1 Tax=Champsocephalus esox TaxID=159716 RepID=A0AAN8CN27_9TELE|nr:hypothetical protein CesoFtcFv8_004758 [Champsocephalus esox]